MMEEFSNAKTLHLKSKKKTNNDVMLMMPFLISLAVILMITIKICLSLLEMLTGQTNWIIGKAVHRQHVSGMFF